MGFLDKLTSPRRQNAQAQREARKQERVRQSRDSLSPKGERGARHGQDFGSGRRSPAMHRERTPSPPPQHRRTPSQDSNYAPGPLSQGLHTQSQNYGYSYRQYDEHYYHPTKQPMQPHEAPQQESMMSKIKSVMTFGQGRSSSRGRNTSDSGASAAIPPSGGSLTQVRDLQHRISVLQSQVQEVDELKRRLTAEQRLANEWKEKWNYQNFKVNLLVDMLVLRVLEGEGGVAATKHDVPATKGQGGTNVQVISVGSRAAQSTNSKVQQGPEMIEESFDDY